MQSVRRFVKVAGATVIVACGLGACSEREEGMSDVRSFARTAIDQTRQRNLEAWKPLVRDYSVRHYGQDTWELSPGAVVLHYTAGSGFPWNLVESESYNGEAPGVACHYVVEETRVFQILPDNVRARCALGANHRALGIEIVARNEDDLFHNHPSAMKTAADLTVMLLKEHGIPVSEVFSHQQIDRFDGLIPWVFDLVTNHGSGKIDPGQRPMEFMLARIREGMRSPGGSAPQSLLATTGDVEANHGEANLLAAPTTSEGDVSSTF